MLFGYPLAATNENWLHFCLCRVVKRVHILLDAGKLMPKWPTILPKAYRELFLRRKGLNRRVTAYANAALLLSQVERNEVLAVMKSQNRIIDLLSGTHTCNPVDILPTAVREPIRNLFDYGFERLTDFGVRDRQYRIIHKSLSYKICPFCGCEYFESTKGPREALDHYLAKSKYPFAASNLRNLAPMGYKCNSLYKKAKDILYRDDGTRRKAFDPYNAPGLIPSLSRSVVNNGVNGGIISQWIVDFSLAGEETETWSSVFKIRERYERDFLDEHSFNAWLGEFQSWHKKSNHALVDDKTLLSAVNKYSEFLIDGGFNDRAFLKAALFKMLIEQCNAGHVRVLEVLRDLVGLPQPA